VARKPVTVAALAAEADLDLDEAIVTLWDAGIETVEAPEDIVPRDQLRTARVALGVDDLREQRTVAYWMSKASVDRAGLTEVLAEMGIRLPPNARVLPTGALKRLRRRYAASLTLPAIEDAPVLEAPPPLDWRDIGQRRDIRFLTEQDVGEVHLALVRDFADADDPIVPPGVRSADLLSSAVHRPQTSMGNEAKYPTVEMAAAALLHSLVLNHPFHNGNKRTGIVAMLVFLDRNNFLPTCDEKSLFRFVLRVAQHGLVPGHWDDIPDREVLEMAQWVLRNTRPIQRGERRVRWHRLQRTLRKFGCGTDHVGGVGNRINIYRTVSRRARFGRERSEQLRVQVFYAGEGTEVEKNTLNFIRQELELDEEHGYDSKIFYEDDSEPDDFIQQYRTLLRRLARL
jgi:death-on-curing family protein